jgi:hypothetical protein
MWCVVLVHASGNSGVVLILEKSHGWHWCVYASVQVLPPLLEWYVDICVSVYVVPPRGG